MSRVRWRNITNPFRFSGWLYRFWARFCCVRVWHLLDEVASPREDYTDQGPFMHYLYCDACEMIVEIID